MSAACGHIKADLTDTLCTKAGWGNTGKYVLVALATIACLGLALALAMKFSPSLASSSVGQQLSTLAGGKLITYVLASSASLLGVLAAGRAARSCGVI